MTPLALSVLALCHFQLATGSALEINAAVGSYGWLPSVVCHKAEVVRRSHTPYFDAANQHNDLEYGQINDAPIIGHF